MKNDEIRRAVFEAIDAAAAEVNESAGEKIVFPEQARLFGCSGEKLSENYQKTISEKSGAD